MTKNSLKASIAAVIKNNPATKLRGNVHQAKLFEIIDHIHLGLFHNDRVEVNASRNLQASDESCLLLIGADDVALTMPSTSPFSEGAIFGVMCFKSGFSITTANGGAPLYALGGETYNEFLQFKHYEGELILLNTGVIFDFKDDKRKTSTKFFYDKATTIPSYADDAAADADTQLLSGFKYKLTGDRTVYIKP